MCLAGHMVTIRDRYVGRILYSRFEVTRTTLYLGLFDMEMELDSYDTEMAAPVSFDDVEMELDSYRLETVAQFSFDYIFTIIQRNHQKQLDQQGQDRKWRIHTAMAVEEAGWGRSR